MLELMSMEIGETICGIDEGDGDRFDQLEDAAVVASMQRMWCCWLRTPSSDWVDLPDHDAEDEGRISIDDPSTGRSR